MNRLFHALSKKRCGGGAESPSAFAFLRSGFGCLYCG
jgi:hypothetical protein